MEYNREKFVYNVQQKNIVKNIWTRKKKQKNITFSEFRWKSRAQNPGRRSRRDLIIICANNNFFYFAAAAEIFAFLDARRSFTAWPSLKPQFVVAFARARVNI